VRIDSFCNFGSSQIGEEGEPLALRNLSGCGLLVRGKKEHFFLFHQISVLSERERKKKKKKKRKGISILAISSRIMASKKRVLLAQGGASLSVPRVHAERGGGEKGKR